MAHELGNNIVIKYNTAVIVGETSSSIATSLDVIEVTDKGDSGAKTYLSGDYGGTISFEGNFDQAGAQGCAELIADQLTPASRAFIHGGTDSGDEIVSGNCFVTSLSKSAPNNEKATFTADLQMTGAITAGVVS